LDILEEGKIMTYVLPTNVTRMSELFVWADQTVSGWLGPMILLSLFIVSYITTNAKTESGNAFTFSSILVTIVAILFRIIGIVDTYVLFICIILAALGVLNVSKERSYY
jgi:hypothetical protein